MEFWKGGLKLPCNNTTGGVICYIDDPGSTIKKLAPEDVLALDEAEASWAAENRYRLAFQY